MREITVETVEDIRAEVAIIEAQGGDDPEDSHWRQDALYVATLQRIALGVENASELAREALRVEGIEFPRWYA